MKGKNNKNDFLSNSTLSKIIKKNKIGKKNPTSYQKIAIE